MGNRIINEEEDISHEEEENSAILEILKYWSLYSTSQRRRGSMNLDGIRQGGGGPRKGNFEGDI